MAEEHCRFFSSDLPSRSREKAIRTYEKGSNFIRLGPIVVFLGEKEDHLLYPPHYCSCTDFKINSLIRKTRGFCYHIYAYCLSEQRGKVTFIKSGEHADSDSAPMNIILKIIVREVFYNGRSATVRRLVASK